MRAKLTNIVQQFDRRPLVEAVTQDKGSCYEPVNGFSRIDDSLALEINGIFTFYFV